MTAKKKLDRAIATNRSRVAAIPAPRPEREPPGVVLPAPKVHIETVEFARSLDKVEQTLQSVLQAMAQHDARLVRTTEHLTSLLKQLAKQDIKVDLPDINMPERPTSFTVFVDDGDEAIEMRIEANSPD